MVHQSRDVNVKTLHYPKEQFTHNIMYEQATFNSRFSVSVYACRLRIGNA